MTNEDIKEIKMCRRYAYEIYTDKELSIFPDTEPYRSNIKAIFSDYPLLDELDLDKTVDYRCISYKQFVFDTIDFCKKYHNIRINPKTVDAIRTGLLPVHEAFFSYLRTLYLPSEYHNDYEGYLWLCKSLFFSAERYWENHKIDTGNYVLNEMYHYMKNIQNNDLELYTKIKYTTYALPSMIVSGHLLANHKLNRKSFGEIINNMDFYLERLSLIYDINKMNFNMKNIHNVIYVRDNYDRIFQKGKIIIK